MKNEEKPVKMRKKQKKKMKNRRNTKEKKGEKITMEENTSRDGKKRKR